MGRIIKSINQKFAQSVAEHPLDHGQANCGSNNGGGKSSPPPPRQIPLDYSYHRGSIMVFFKAKNFLRMGSVGPSLKGVWDVAHLPSWLQRI